MLFLFFLETVRPNQEAVFSCMPCDQIFTFCSMQSKNHVKRYPKFEVDSLTQNEIWYSCNLESCLLAAQKFFDPLRLRILFFFFFPLMGDMAR